MFKFFRIPFANSGNKTSIPDDADSAGNVSYSEGYTFDYQRPSTDPAAKNIERQKMNAIFSDITTSISEIQSQGIPDFITPALNNGVAYSYPINAVVRFNDVIYYSKVAVNTATPADLSKWGVVPFKINSDTGFKNRVINGAMVFDQRNAGASVTPTTSTYTLDRWHAIMQVTSKYSVQQNAGSVTPPVGFTKYLGITSLSSYSTGAAEAFLLNHYIEGCNTADFAFGTASATSITLSFWVRSSLTGVFSLSICNELANRVYITNYTINSANTWEPKTITITGDTSGTWQTNKAIGAQIRFDLGSGANFNGTAGAWGSSNLLRTSGSQSIVGTNGATFYLTGVQLEKGSTATSFDYRPYGAELSLCQEYYWNAIGVFGNIPAWTWQTTQFGTTIWFPVAMRTAPTIITKTATNGYSFYMAGATYNFDTLNANNANILCADLNVTTSGKTAGQGGFFSVNAGGLVAFESELK